jgi:hypothetical protein
VDIEKIKERVKKMLNLGRNSGATEGERDNAMRMAMAYLAKYNLDMAEVESHQTQAEKDKSGEPRTTHAHTFFGRPWARCAAIAIADMCFCAYLYRSAKLSKNTQHMFIGRTSNAVTAAYLAEYVVTSINNEGRKRQRQLGEPNPWFISFAWGAARAVQERVAELKRSGDKPKSSGTDLVLANVYENERRANLEYQAVAFPRVREGLGGKGITNAMAAMHGAAYGSTIKLDRQMR